MATSASPGQGGRGQARERGDRCFCQQGKGEPLASNKSSGDEEYEVESPESIQKVVDTEMIKEIRACQFEIFHNKKTFEKKSAEWFCAITKSSLRGPLKHTASSRMLVGRPR